MVGPAISLSYAEVRRKHSIVVEDNGVGIDLARGSGIFVLRACLPGMLGEMPPSEAVVGSHDRQDRGRAHRAAGAAL